MYKILSKIFDNRTRSLNPDVRKLIIESPKSQKYGIINIEIHSIYKIIKIQVKRQ